MNDLANEPQRMGFWEALRSGCGTPADKRNQRRCLYWLLAWVLAMAAAARLIEDSTVTGAAAWIAAAVPTPLAIGVVVTFLRYLREADELLRKVQVEGLAIGFGAGIVFAFGYGVFELAGAPALDTHELIIVMTLGWVLGQLTGTWRYR